MKSKTRWVLSVAVVAVVVAAGVGLATKTQADVDVDISDCVSYCPPTIGVNDNMGGVYICRWEGTCSHEPLESCNYEPLESCLHFPGGYVR